MVGKKSLFNTWGVGTIGHPWKRMKLDPCITPYIRINSVWSKDLSIRVKTIKLFEVNLGGNLHNLGFGNAFLDRRPNMINKRKNLDFIKVKNFCSSKDTDKRVKRQ